MSNSATRPGTAATGRSNLVAGTRLTGDLTVPGTLELTGHVDGRIAADAVSVEEPGSINGEITAAIVSIKGAFGGRITGGAVKLLSTARVTGEVHYDTIMIESGAQVDATFTQRKTEPPPPEPTPAPPPAASATPTTPSAPPPSPSATMPSAAPKGEGAAAPKRTEGAPVMPPPMPGKGS
ncbi:MAG: polymer-forming cytoskeletal protein [Rubellimicrobium sp.]|nr:polymer-forming cytoskeletal protein [Rubellimicrobium sp.]